MLTNEEILDHLINNNDLRDSITMKDIYDWGNRVDLQLRSTGYNEITLGFEDGSKVTLTRKNQEPVVLRFESTKNTVETLEVYPTTYFYDGIERLFVGGASMSRFAINWVIDQVIKSRLKTIFPDCFHNQIIL